MQSEIENNQKKLTLEDALGPHTKTEKPENYKDETVNSRYSDSKLPKPDRNELDEQKQNTNFTLPEDRKAGEADSSAQESQNKEIPDSVRQAREQMAQNFESQGMNNIQVPPEDQMVPDRGE